MIGSQQKTPEEILSDHGGLLVRRVAQREDSDEVTQALFEVATRGKTEWTHDDAKRLADSLLNCDMTVSKWLKTHNG